MSGALSRRSIPDYYGTTGPEVDALTMLWQAVDRSTVGEISIKMLDIKY